MSRSVRLATTILAVFSLQALLPALAEAQLGGLVKKAKKAAEEKVEGALPFTPLPAPEFTDRVLEITGDRLTRLLKGFAAEAAHAKTAVKEYEEQVKNAEAQAAAYEKAREAYNRDSDAYQACAAKFREAEMKSSAATEAAVERVLAEMNSEEFETYIMRLAERGEKIALAVQAGRNDPASIREREAYQREAAVMVKEQQRRMKVAMAGISAEQQRARTENPRLVQACGQEPKAPQQPNSGVGGAEGVLLGHGARAAGLDGEEASTPESVESYKIMRERVLSWVEEKQRPSRMGFSSDEIKVLESQAGAVKQVVSDMKKAGVPL